MRTVLMLERVLVHVASQGEKLKLDDFGTEEKLGVQFFLRPEIVQFQFSIWTPMSTGENLSSYLPWFDRDKKRVPITVDQKQHGTGSVRD
jgi:hypothetical protein